MTILNNPWKLARVMLVAAAVSLMFVRIGCQPIYQDEPKGCAMTTHEE